MSGSRQPSRPPLRRRAKEVVGNIPLVGQLSRLVYRLFRYARYRWRGSSKDYWEARYAAGDDSGDGSYGKLAEFKARTLNDFVAEFKLQSVVEFGCGDGNQLKLAEYPQYLGLDVSPTAVARCRRLFSDDPSRTFSLLDDYQGERADLALSLDVLYHLVEDEVFADYLRRLFASAASHVCIYSSNYNDPPKVESHVRHRKFTSYVEEHFPTWRLLRSVPNAYPLDLDPKGSFADFYFYERREPSEQ